MISGYPTMVTLYLWTPPNVNETEIKIGQLWFVAASYRLKSSPATSPSFAPSPLSLFKLSTPCNTKQSLHLHWWLSKQTYFHQITEVQTPLGEAACTAVIDGFMNLLHSNREAPWMGLIKTQLKLWGVSNDFHWGFFARMWICQKCPFWNLSKGGGTSCHSKTQTGILNA